MAERATINQIAQIGVEATPGTPVAATKRLQGVGISPSFAITIDMFGPMGNKFDTVAVEGDESSTAAINGKPTYNELPYLLASIMGKNTPVTATGATTWTFGMQPMAPDNVQTYTVEHGPIGGVGERMPYALVNALTLTQNGRRAFDLSGTMIGQALATGFTMTGAGVTAPAMVPIVPKNFDVFMDPTFAALGTTKLLKHVSSALTIDSRFAPAWYTNSAVASFSSHVETKPRITFTTMLNADPVAMGLIPVMRIGDRRYLRWTAAGPGVGTAADTYLFQCDMVGEVSAVSPFSDQGGIYAIDYTWTIVDDGSNPPITIKVVNALTSL